MPNRDALVKRILARLERLQAAYIRQSEAAEPHSKRAAVLDAKAIALGQAHAAVKEEAARPLAETARQPQTPETGAGAIKGQWPGDETDEEIAEALAALS